MAISQQQQKQQQQKQQPPPSSSCILWEVFQSRTVRDKSAELEYLWEQVIFFFFKLLLLRSEDCSLIGNFTGKTYRTV